MKQQKSFEEGYEKGILYLVPTPIGNLEDITFRAISTLKDVDWIAAEDTRNTKKLCNYFDIQTPLISYHEHNKEKSGKHIIQLLEEGKKVAIVSDAGMPAISDPGFDIVSWALEKDFKVISLPGANAALTALTASGLPPQPFYFYGFLNRKKKDRIIELEKMKYIKDTIVFYEAPHRLKDTIETILEVFGDRKIVLARELTKKYEEYIRGTLRDIIGWIDENEVRGEFCIIVEGTMEEEQKEECFWENLSLNEHVQTYINQGYSTKEAIKKVAAERNLSKRDVYREFHTKEE